MLHVAGKRVVLRGDGGRRTQHLHRLARHTPAQELGAQSIVASARLLSRRNPSPRRCQRRARGESCAATATDGVLQRDHARVHSVCDQCMPECTACALNDAFGGEGSTGGEQSPERPTRPPRPPARRSRWASPGTGANSPQCAPPPAVAMPPRPASVPAPECREAAERLSSTRCRGEEKGEGCDRF